MDANIILDKIVEKGLNINETLEICEKLCEPDKVTLGDVARIKKILGLSNPEAIDIFLS